jgi:ABC-type Fe3+ transport system substrate-binding protein
MNRKINFWSASALVLIALLALPLAARVFINWLLSRDGQTSFQKIMNTPDLVMESMRVDISKDPIAPEKRRAPGVKYIVMDTPERSNQEPVSKLLKEVIKQ